MIVFRERLRPSAGFLLAAAGVGGLVGVVLLRVHAVAGIVTGSVLAVAAVAAVIATSPVVELRDGVLYAAAAHIDVGLLGEPVSLPPEAWRERLGPGADARAFVCQRPWSTAGVMVAVLDQRDPAPYWLIASREPERLADVLSGAVQAAHSEHTS